MTSYEMILSIFAGCHEMHSFVFDIGVCHLCSLENWVAPHQRLDTCRGTAKFSSGDKISGHKSVFHAQTTPVARCVGFGTADAD